MKTRRYFKRKTMRKKTHKRATHKRVRFTVRRRGGGTDTDRRNKLANMKLAREEKKKEEEANAIKALDSLENFLKENESESATVKRINQIGVPDNLAQKLAKRLPVKRKENLYQHLGPLQKKKENPYNRLNPLQRNVEKTSTETTSTQRNIIEEPVIDNPEILVLRKSKDLVIPTKKTGRMKRLKKWFKGKTRKNVELPLQTMGEVRRVKPIYNSLSSPKSAKYVRQPGGPGTDSITNANAAYVKFVPASKQSNSRRSNSRRSNKGTYATPQRIEEATYATLK